MKKSRLWRILHKPLMGTRVIPPDARADCAKLSEEEFPVFCPKCDYQLRGLPDGKCPECGKLFERARFLVEQYVRPWGKSSWRRTIWRRTTSGRIAYWSFVVIAGCGALYLVTSVLLFAWAMWASRQDPLPLAGFGSTLRWAHRLFLALLIATPVSLAVFVPIVFGQMRDKRRRVLDAVPIDSLQND